MTESMTVDVQGEGDRRVSESLGDDLRMNARLQGERRMRVAEVMQSDPRESGIAREFGKAHRHYGRTQKVSIRPGKNELAGNQRLPVLRPRLKRSKNLDGARVESDHSAAACSLRL